uniref:myc-associated zinc finger protein-like isoform X1 n=1 Tax=Myxine glutinosa TaxID=7769 RepID=UPI00358DF554
MDANWTSYLYQNQIDTSRSQDDEQDWFFTLLHNLSRSHHPPTTVTESLPQSHPVGADLLSALAPEPTAPTTSPGGGKRSRGRSRKGESGSRAASASGAGSEAGAVVGGGGSVGIGSGGIKTEKARAPFVCSYCAKGFRDNYHLRRHEARHTGVKVVGPSRPRKTSNTSGATAASVMMGDGGVMVSAGGVGGKAGDVTGTPPVRRVRKNHACELCGKAFRDVYHLNRHRLSHSDEKPFECPVCRQRFKRKDRMTYHVRMHDGGVQKPYVCDHCAKGFSRPDHLNNHVRQVHSTERPFKCQTCEAAFATRDRLRAHSARHEERVPCQLCGKHLATPYLADHMKMHKEGTNNGLCTICHKESCKHLGWAPEKKHACPQCGSTFKTKSHLNRHLTQVHLAKGKAGAATVVGTGGPALAVGAASIGAGAVASLAAAPTAVAAVGAPVVVATATGAELTLGPSPVQHYLPVAATVATVGHGPMSVLETFGYQVVQSAYAAPGAPSLEPGQPTSVVNQ